MAKFKNHNISKQGEHRTRVIGTGSGYTLHIGHKSAYRELEEKIGPERAKRCKLESRRFTWCFREPVGKDK